MTYMYPFPQGTEKTQLFGENPNNGYNPGGGHTGDDWKVPVGTPIRAAANGVIRNSGWLSDNYQDNGWWLTRMGGDTLVLDATDSFGRSDTLPTFIYAHCSDSTAEVGQYVRKGDIIGYSGNTGTATSGPHCHVETLPPSWDFNNGTYGRVNPETYFDEYYMEIGFSGQIVEDDMDPNTVFVSKDGAQVTFNALLNSIDTKIDGFPQFDKNVRATFDIVRMQNASLTAAVGTLADLVSKGNTSVSSADILSQIDKSIKEAVVSVNVSVNGKPA